MAQSPHSISNVSTRSTHSSDIRTSALLHPVPVAEYLCRRLFEIGIRAVHGVAGAHNLRTLDYLDHCGLTWVGNCNELNAGYAADGYARIKGISALFTSYGASELSAFSAIAGAYTEYVPIIHVVGAPPTHAQSNASQMFHPLGNGNVHTFSDMSRPISCSVVTLTDPSQIANQIDHTIKECWSQSRPVYISLPSDIAQQHVEGDQLRTAIDLAAMPNDPDKEDYVVEVVLRYMHAANNPVILVDACAIRHRALLETHNLVERSALPTFVSPMGKGAVNEAMPNYSGVYAGDGSEDEVRARVESADLVLSIGGMKSDFSTAHWNYRASELSTIDFYANMVRIKYSEYPDLRMDGVLRKLSERLGQLKIVPGPSPSNNVPTHRRDNREEITHTWFWRHMARWLLPNDIVIIESGATNFGIWETRFPSNVTAISQILWNSTGYATAACQGAALAATELSRAREGWAHRTILFTTDAGFHLTSQEIATMIKLRLNPTIFVLCNNVHPADKVVNGPSIHDTTPWRYRDLLSAFGAEKGTYQSCSLHTRKQVQALFADEVFSSASQLQFVELRIGRERSPTPSRAANGVPYGSNGASKYAPNGIPGGAGDMPGTITTSSSRYNTPSPSQRAFPVRTASSSTYGTRNTMAT